MAGIEKTITIKGVAPWFVTRDPGTGRYVGSCQVLNLSTEADSWAELTHMTADATDLLLGALAKSGELEEFLRERGFSIETTFKQVSDPKFDIPSPISYGPALSLA